MTYVTGHQGARRLAVIPAVVAPPSPAPSLTFIATARQLPDGDTNVLGQLTAAG